jgi:aspartyl protease family protein
MRNLVIAAAGLMIVCGYGGKMMSETAIKTPAARIAVSQPAEQQRQAYGDGQHTMVLVSDRAGHFQADARVDGRAIDFVVDTGASLVVLRESAAAQVQIFPKASDYTARVSTANGTIKAAPTTLSRIQVGDITVFDVPALVLPDEALDKNLLGVSFLSRLRRYEYANGRMVLEQ